MYQGKKGRTEHSKINKTVPEKVATTRTEDGHKQNTKTSTTIYVDQKDEGTQEDRRRDGGTNFILWIKDQETRLTLHEYDDDDDKDDYAIFRSMQAILMKIIDTRKQL